MFQLNQCDGCQKTINQCDGCQKTIPKEGEFHVYTHKSGSRSYVGCTKDRYTEEIEHWVNGELCKRIDCKICHSEQPTEEKKCKCGQDNNKHYEYCFLENKPSTEPSWSEEFEEKFAGRYGYCNQTIAKQIKEFISKIESQAENRINAEWREIIECMKYTVQSEFDVGSEFSTPRLIRQNGYNQALKDLLNNMEK